MRTLVGSIGLNRRSDQPGRLRLEEIGLRLSRHEALSVPILALFALNGDIPFVTTAHFAGAGKQSYHLYEHVSLIVFVASSLFAFWTNRLRVHWELWTIRFSAVFLAWVLLSVSWSTLSLRELYSPVAIAICTFCYINYVLDRFTVIQFTRILIWMYTILLTLSIATVIIAPGIGRDSGVNDPALIGSWQGIFDQKNSLGLAAAVAFAIALGLRPETRVDRAWRRLLVILSTTCAIGSRSREAWICIAVMVILFPLLSLLRSLSPRSRLAVVSGIFFLGVFVVPLIYFNLNVLLTLLGRDPTLSGRTNIWSDTMLLIAKRPWLGYGMYGVWGSPYAFDVYVREGWQVTSSHNSYLETVLSYGLIGLVLFMPIPLSSSLFMFRAVMNYDLRRLMVLIFIIVVCLMMSVVMPLILYSPGIGLLLLQYCVANLEKVERTGLMSIKR